MAGRRNLNVREDLILDILLGNGDDSDLEAISDDEADTSALRKEVSEQILALLGEGVEGNVPSYDQEEGEGDAAINGEEEEEDTVAGGIGDDEVNAEGGGDDEVNAEEVGDDEVNAEEVGDDEVNAEGGGDDEVNAEGGGNRVHIPGGGGDQGDKVTSSKKKGKPTQKRGRKRKVTASNKNNKKSAKKSKTTKKKKSRPNWEEGKFISKVLSLDIDGDLEMPESSTPLQYFKEYFPDEFFERTANFTNMYCLSKFGKELNTNAAEIKKVFGMHLLMGCLKYPRLRMYWSAGYGLEAIQKAMPRDRFFLLRNCLHVVDVNNPPAIRDRLWKVQPVLDAVKNGCDKIERQPGNYSIDEQMVPFLGRTTLRQYVPNKPRPVGLKNFVITTSEGIMIDFFLYQGSQTNLPTKQELGLGPSVVMRLKDSAPPLSVLYFDRYFTSVSLMKKLLEEQYFATGTMITNRLQNIKFTQPTMMRGDFEERISPDNNLVALKWMDNKPVVILSSVCGSGPVTPVLRWSKQSKTFENVDCPAAIVTYNKNMGGVDTLNQLIEAYRTWFKTRKWTLKVILHFLDLVVVNCWLLYRRNSRLRKEPKKNVMDLLMFRLSIAEALKDCPTGQEEVNGEEVVEPVNPKPQNWRAPLPGTDKRRDGFNHWPVTDTLSTARACRYSDCTSRTRVRCEKCNVYLCLTKDKNCFKSFHTS